MSRRPAGWPCIYCRKPCVAGQRNNSGKPAHLTCQMEHEGLLPWELPVRKRSRKR